MTPELLHRAIVFEAGRRWHDRVTWIALAAFTIVLGFGAYDYWTSLPPRPEGDRLFSDAYLLGLALAFHFGIAHDRSSCFDSFMSSNLAPPLTLYLAKLATGLLMLIAFTAVAFLLALAMAVGDVAYAAQRSFHLFGIAMVLVPLIVALELIVTFRYPTVLVLLIAFTTLAVYSRFGDTRTVLSWTGLDAQVGAAEFALRLFVTLAVLAALYPAYRLRVLRTR